MDDSPNQVGELVRRHRMAQNLTVRQLAERAGMNYSTVSRLETGGIARLEPDRLRRLAVALGLPAVDLLALAGYEKAEELPSFPVYLRSRYSDELPEAALTELEDYLDYLRQKYSTADDASPAPGADE